MKWHFKSLCKFVQNIINFIICIKFLIVAISPVQQINLYTVHDSYAHDCIRVDIKAVCQKGHVHQPLSYRYDENVHVRNGIFGV